MPRERAGTRANNAAITLARQPAQRRLTGESAEELRYSARARRAEVALVSSYLRALRRLGEVPIAAPHPEMPH